VLVTTEETVQKDEVVKNLQTLVGKSFDHPVWKVLNERCIACGKCSIACPTCYCFDLVDTAHPDGASRDRVWGDCFYSEFTRIAGNYIFLKNPAEKLFFWYTHKFSRVPAQTGFPGCVGCRRCYEVCPVFIDIEETLADLKTDKAEKSTK
jgi:formate hydrogenlyase subunit 6/NADH:ubiquinone oxidoreductase subunit I